MLEMKHKTPEGHVHSHTLEPYQLRYVSHLAVLKLGTLKPLLGTHTLISSLSRLRWLGYTTPSPLASHCPSFCTPLLSFFSCCSAPLALLPVVFNTSPGQPGSQAAACFLPQKSFHQGSHDLSNRLLHI